eukprot:TRINITY_DN3639_c0_g1_i1.p1 TRINITY_DN3639_c0_g1~~TRINITY_DN3639_c0_g1_i1.p1  ORF type:complete len:501 (-),score=99.81 TRINITY_DN3639_c0_g1_i1:286-1788(-)
MKLEVASLTMSAPSTADGRVPMSIGTAAVLTLISARAGSSSCVPHRHGSFSQQDAPLSPQQQLAQNLVAEALLSASAPIYLATPSPDASVDELENWLRYYDEWGFGLTQYAQPLFYANVRMQDVLEGDVDHDLVVSALPGAPLAHTKAVALCANSAHELHFKASGRPRGAERSVFITSYEWTLIHVNDVGCEFTAEIGFELEWEDPDGACSELEEVELDTDTAWKPQLVFTNALSGPEVRSEHMSRKDGHVRYSFLGQGMFREILELGRFPFDRQLLHTQICHAPSQKLRFVSQLQQRPLSLSKEIHWECADPSLSVFSMDKVYGTAGFILCGRVQRNPSYYMWNVVVPLVLIVAMAALGLCVPPHDIASRLGVTLTLVLTAVTFKIIISGYLPKTSYLTLLEIYAVLSFGVLALVGVENVVAFVLSDTPFGGVPSVHLMGDDHDAVTTWGDVIDTATVRGGLCALLAVHVAAWVAVRRGWFFVPWDSLEDIQEGDKTAE